MMTFPRVVCGLQKFAARLSVGVFIMLALRLIEAAAAEPVRETALAAAARDMGITATGLKVTAESPLPQFGIRRFKVVDDAGMVHGIDIDPAGHAVSPVAVEERISRFTSQGFVGKLERALAERFTGAASQGPVRVLIALRDPQADRMPPFSSGMAGQGYRAVLESRMAAIQRPLIEHLATHNQGVVYASRYVPAVIASVDAQTLRQLEGRVDVERIYLEKVHQPRLDISRPVIQADVVQRRGVQGGRVRLAIVEAGLIGRHAALPASQRSVCGASSMSSVSMHKTNVAGILQSGDAVFRGVAPRVRLIDAVGNDFSDAEMMRATDCAIGQGAAVMSMSFGTETNGSFDGLARYMDGIAHRTGVTLAVAVSNFCENRMGSPEIAFNVLAVGAFADRGTVDFRDDIHACDAALSPSFSAFLDPLSPHGDREEPDIVAPGADITTTQPESGFDQVSGTSFAAPHAAGTAALLVNRRPELANQNERVRAVMMASARHNIEGSSRLSERDGAGAIMAAAADRVLLDGQSWFKTTAGGPVGFPYTQTFRASAGERVRVVVVWSHKMPLGSTLAQPTTDLDLVVLRGRTVLGTSTSFDNTFEIVEFTAPVTGTYTARIQNRRSSRGPERLGLAVSRRNL